MPNTNKKSLYNNEVYQNCLTRLNAITPETNTDWGKMNAAQMFAHCAEVLEVMNGKNMKIDIMSRLLKPIIRATVIGNKAYSKSSPTAPQFEIKTAKNFQQEKERLFKALDSFYSMDKSKASSLKHSYFGVLSLEERGWSMYKHLNHHLNQFGQLELATQTQHKQPSYTWPHLAQNLMTI